jgi:hypothetical protein
MARPGVTLDEVIAVAESFVANGIEPTIRNVRERLGGGSPNTVHRHLTAWRERARKSPVAPTALPDSIIKVLLTEFDNLAAAASSDARKARLAAETEAADLARAMDALQAEMDTMRAELEQLRQERDEIRGRHAERSTEATRLAQEVEGLRQQLKQTELEARLAGARGEELTSLRGELERERERRVSAEQAAAVAVARLEERGRAG